MNYDPDLMPEELKEDKRISKAIDVVDLIIWGAFLAFAYMTKGMVASALTIPYIVGMFLIGFILTRKDEKRNPKKKLYDSLRFMFIRPTTTFISETVEEDVLDNDFEIAKPWEIENNELDEEE